jgi:hypothetical protein
LHRSAVFVVFTAALLGLMFLAPPAAARSSSVGGVVSIKVRDRDPKQFEDFKVDYTTRQVRFEGTKCGGFGAGEWQFHGEGTTSKSGIEEHIVMGITLHMLTPLTFLRPAAEAYNGTFTASGSARGIPFRVGGSFSGTAHVFVASTGSGSIDFGKVRVSVAGGLSGLGNFSLGGQGASGQLFPFDVGHFC